MHASTHSSKKVYRLRAIRIRASNKCEVLQTNVGIICTNPRWYRLLVLVSQGRQPTAASLTTPAPAPSQSELAVQHLLNVVRSGASGVRLSGPRGTYAPRTLSFLSSNVPRDRRGRIAHRPGSLSLDETGSDLEDDIVTPRLGLGPNVGVGARVRERELLESLRSPDPPETRQSVGGWGLGAWDEGINAREKDDDDEDEQMELEQAQVGPRSSGVVYLIADVCLSGCDEA